MASRTFEVLARATGKSVEELTKVSNVYPFALSPFIVQRVEEGSYSLTALKQYLPDIQELENTHGFIPDPTGEIDSHQEQAILQVNDNRLLLLLTYQCLVYCRFCFRKSRVGFPEHQITAKQLENAVAYIQNNPAIEDVVLSGGDPLALPNRKLLPFLEKVVAIPHVKVIRIDSRALSTVPQRLDNELLSFMRSAKKFWYYSHMNHPDDIDHPQVRATIESLLMAGVPVLNQCVILAGINDNVETIYELMDKCYQQKVLPYHLYILDRVQGAAHFDVPMERILEICQALSRLPGPAQPVLIFVDPDNKKHRAIYDEASNLREFLQNREDMLHKIKLRANTPTLSSI
jgi:KamA family protein